MIFLDSFGPVAFHAGEGLDTRPHRHIGFATLTYLIDGEILHRGSAGFLQSIRPSEDKVMTAGCGIVHAERSSDTARASGVAVFGFQSWNIPASHSRLVILWHVGPYSITHKSVLRVPDQHLL